MTVKISDRIKDIVANLNFSFTEAIDDTSFSSAKLDVWYSRIERLSLAIQIDPENVNDYIAFSSLITVMREAAGSVFAYSNRLYAYAKERLNEEETKYQIMFNDIMASSTDVEIKNAKSAGIRDAIVNHRLKDNVQEISNWKKYLSIAENFWTIAQAKDKQIRETWFYIQFQWNAFSNDRGPKDFSRDFDSRHSSEAFSHETAKKPVAPTFVSTKPASPQEGVDEPPQEVKDTADSDYTVREDRVTVSNSDKESKSASILTKTYDLDDLLSQ